MDAFFRNNYRSTTIKICVQIHYPKIQRAKNCGHFTIPQTNLQRKKKADEEAKKRADEESRRKTEREAG